MRDFFQQYMVELAAVVGAMLGLRYVDNLSRVTAASSLASGFACAYFGTPLIVWFVQPPPSIAASVAGLSGLLLGFAGFAILAAFILIVRRSGDAASEGVPNLIKRWLGRFGGKADDSP